MIWPLLLLATLGAGAISLGLAVASGQTWRGRAGWLLLLGMNALTFDAVVRNAPSM